MPAVPDPTQLGFDPDALMGTLDNGPEVLPAVQRHTRGVRWRCDWSSTLARLWTRPDSKALRISWSTCCSTAPSGSRKTSSVRCCAASAPSSAPMSTPTPAQMRPVYSLDVALDDPEALDLAFTVLSQWASAATIRPADVEAERGIVTDEHRLRDESANGRNSNFLDAIYYRGTVYEGMLIGGSEPVHSVDYRRAAARVLRHVVPGPTIWPVVVVGDLPVAELQLKVEEHFGVLAARADALPAQPERHTFTAAFVTEPVADVVTHPDYGDISMSIDWQLPGVAAEHRRRRPAAPHGGADREDARHPPRQRVFGPA